MNRTAYCCVIIMILASAAWATPEHEWSRRFGDSGIDLGWSITVDNLGNVLATGVFEGTVNFGGGDLTSAGSVDVFLVKYSQNGTHIWSQRFGGPGYDEAWGLATDPLGNVVLSGYYEGTANFGGGDLTSNGTYDIFVARYNSNGGHLWSHSYGGPGEDICWAAAVDGSGNAIVSGYFSDTVDFGGGPLVSAGAGDIFIAKYGAAAGAHVWSKGLGDTGWDQGYSLAIDADDNVVATGYFNGAVDFGGGPLIDPGGGDVFLVKYDPSGALVWSQHFGDAAPEQGIKVAIDPFDDIALIGFFYDDIDLGGGTFSSLGISDIFIAKFDADGAHLWSRHDGGTDFDLPWAIAVDAAGAVYTSGSFYGMTNLGGGDFTSAGAADAYVAYYDSDGAHVWSAAFGDTGMDESYGIAVGLPGGFLSDAPVTMVGLFNGTVDFGGGDLTSAGADDAFLVQFRDAGVVGSTALPRVAALGQNHPNPFNPQTTIAYSVAVRTSVAIEIVDSAGRLVDRIEQGVRDPGDYRTTWTGRDSRGRPVPSGVYYYRLAGIDRSKSRKMILLK